MSGSKNPEVIKAYVTVHGIRRLCVVTSHGTPQQEYTEKQVLYIERAEDEYGVASMKEPFCVISKHDFRSGDNAFLKRD